MNVNSYLSPRLMVGAAIVGIVGAAGVFIYEQVYAEKRRAMLGEILPYFLHNFSNYGLCT